jgi:monoamine oxidase
MRITFGLSAARNLQQQAFAAFFLLAVLIFGGRYATAATPASVNCTHGQTPTMTVEIYNDSTDFNIYPVLFAGAQ